MTLANKFKTVHILTDEVQKNSRKISCFYQDREKSRNLKAGSWGSKLSAKKKENHDMRNWYKKLKS